MQFSFIFTEVVKQYGSQLSDYEKQEIEKYPEIWYLGLDSCKINAKPGTPLNCGYDDENGSYNKVSCVRVCLEVIKQYFLNIFDPKIMSH
jgi:dual specificity tyrosine-phosphorylation-regulated kinase 2/3/4